MDPLRTMNTNTFLNSNRKIEDEFKTLGISLNNLNNSTTYDNSNNFNNYINYNSIKTDKNKYTYEINETDENNYETNKENNDDIDENDNNDNKSENVSDSGNINNMKAKLDKPAKNQINKNACEDAKNVHDNVENTANNTDYNTINNVIPLFKQKAHILNKNEITKNIKIFDEESNFVFDESIFFENKNSFFNSFLNESKVLNYDKENNIFADPCPCINNSPNKNNCVNFDLKTTQKSTFDNDDNNDKKKLNTTKVLNKPNYNTIITNNNEDYMNVDDNTNFVNVNKLKIKRFKSDTSLMTICPISSKLLRNTFTSSFTVVNDSKANNKGIKFQFIQPKKTLSHTINKYCSPELQKNVKKYGHLFGDIEENDCMVKSTTNRKNVDESTRFNKTLLGEYLVNNTVTLKKKISEIKSSRSFILHSES